MRREVTTITVMLLALLAGACGRAVEAPDAAAPSPDQSRAGSTPDMQRCANPQDGYSLSYPGSWHTNPGDVLPTCTVFDDEPVELTEGTEVPFDIAVFLDVVDRPISDLDDDLATEVMDRQARQIGGREAVEVRFRSTGHGLLPEDIIGHRILLDLREGSTLIGSSYELDDRPLEDNVDTARQMLRTLDTTVVTPSIRPTPSPPPFHSSTQADTSDGSGAAVNVTDIEVSARDGYPSDTGTQEYSGPDRVEGPGTIREVLYGSIYEGDTELFIGVDRRRPFRVFLLDEPSRVVLDVRHDTG